MARLLIALALVLALGLSVTGCGKSDTGSTGGGGDTTVTEEEAANRDEAISEKLQEEGAPVSPKDLAE